MKSPTARQGYFGRQHFPVPREARPCIAQSLQQCGPLPEARFPGLRARLRYPEVTPMLFRNVQ